MKDKYTDFTLTIIIPVFNEKETIAEIIQEVISVPYKKEIILVDDYSTDGTCDIIQKMDYSELKIVFHDKNYGKG